MSDIYTANYVILNNPIDAMNYIFNVGPAVMVMNYTSSMTQYTGGIYAH